MLTSTRMKRADADTLRKFWTGLKDQLSVSEFEQLRKALKVSNYQFTAMQNGNRSFSYEELLALAEFLQVAPLDLVEQHGLGLSSMSAQEYIRLVELSGKKIQFKDQKK